MGFYCSSVLLDLENDTILKWDFQMKFDVLKTNLMKLLNHAPDSRLRLLFLVRAIRTTTFCFNHICWVLLLPFSAS